MAKTNYSRFMEKLRTLSKASEQHKKLLKYINGLDAVNKENFKLITNVDIMSDSEIDDMIQDMIVREAL